MQRRDFIATLALATGAAVAPRVLRATGAKQWGEFPSWAKSLALPEKLRAKRVVEIMLTGGLSPWETLYCVDLAAYGKANKQMWWTFQDSAPSLAAMLSVCNSSISSAPEFFAKDALGVDVKLGPLVDGLRRRPDLLARMRLMVMSHDLFPHAPAQVLAVTGVAPGAPRVASPAAVFERWAAQSGPKSTYPHSWVIAGAPRCSGTEEVGLHGAASVPMTLGIGDWYNVFTPLLEFKNEPAAIAELRALGHAQVAARMRPPASSQPLRSQGRLARIAAEIKLGKLQNLQDVLPQSLFDGKPAQLCTKSYSIDVTAARMNLARHLLTFKGNNTRYALVEATGHADTAPMPDGFDFHINYAERAARLVPPVFSELVAQIAKPGEANAAKIDLDDTLVVINTEFGRSPGTQQVTGRNHHPQAYVTAMIGGPLQKAQKGIVGAIDATASAVSPVTPAETRAAMFVAAGIWPFESDLFSYHDVTGATSELDAIKRLRTVGLGIPL